MRILSRKNVLKRLLSFILVLMLLTSMGVAFAAEGDAPAAGGEVVQEASFMEKYGTIVIIVVMVAFFYLFLIRPESKKKKKAAEMRSSITAGDTITTIGGIIGKVVEIKDDTITFETGEDRVRMQVTKWAVSTVGKATEEPPK